MTWKMNDDETRMTTEEVRRKIAALEDHILFLEQQIREKPWETYTDAELRRKPWET